MSGIFASRDVMKCKTVSRAELEKMFNTELANYFDNFTFVSDALDFKARVKRSFFNSVIDVVGKVNLSTNGTNKVLSLSADVKPNSGFWLDMVASVVIFFCVGLIWFLLFAAMVGFIWYSQKNKANTALSTALEKVAFKMSGVGVGKQESMFQQSLQSVQPVKSNAQCPNCGATIASGISQCPYCDTKLH